MGEKIFNFRTIDDFEEYFSESGFNVVKYPLALSKEKVYYMLYQKYITNEVYEKTKMEDEYQYLYKKDSELKVGNITVDNESVVEYGNDI